jgi:hypothetical protein
MCIIYSLLVMREEKSNAYILNKNIFWLLLEKMKFKERVFTLIANSSD